jgi:hypothetical protein
MKLLHTPKVKPKTELPRKIKLAQAMGARVTTNVNGAKVNWA